MCFSLLPQQSGFPIGGGKLWISKMQLIFQQHDSQCYAYFCSINKSPQFLFFNSALSFTEFQNDPQKAALHSQTFSDWQGATGQCIESDWKLEAMWGLDVEEPLYRYRFHLQRRMRIMIKHPSLENKLFAPKKIPITMSIPNIILLD